MGRKFKLEIAYTVDQNYAHENPLLPQGGIGVLEVVFDGLLVATIGADSKRSATFFLQHGHFTWSSGIALEATNSSKTASQFLQR